MVYIWSRVSGGRTEASTGEWVDTLKQCNQDGRFVRADASVATCLWELAVSKLALEANTRRIAEKRGCFDSFCGFGAKDALRWTPKKRASRQSNTLCRLPAHVKARYRVKNAERSRKTRTLDHSQVVSLGCKNASLPRKVFDCSPHRILGQSATKRRRFNDTRVRVGDELQRIGAPIWIRLTRGMILRSVKLSRGAEMAFGGAGRVVGLTISLLGERSNQLGVDCKLVACKCSENERTRPRCLQQEGRVDFVSDVGLRKLHATRPAQSSVQSLETTLACVAEVSYAPLIELIGSGVVVAAFYASQTKSKPAER
jgi:hypothetical protein